MSDERLNLVNEGESHDMYMPEGKPCSPAEKVPNKGEIMFPEKHPVDPLRSKETQHMSHRGGLASARTEHY